MKKSLMFATSLAICSIAGSAMALNAERPRVLQVDGIGLNLGVLTFTPLGADGRFCDYLADWASPFNPNDVGLCVLQELRTSFAPSCIASELADVVTLVTSADVCTGFNLKGEASSNVSLILAESECGLSGLAVIPAGGAAATYPVSSY